MKVLCTDNFASPYRIDFYNELGKYCDLTVVYERERASDRDKSWIGNSPSSYRAIFLENVFNTGASSAFCPVMLNYIKDSVYDLIVIGEYSTPTAILANEYMRYKKIPFVLNADGGFIKNEVFLKRNFKKHLISSAQAYLSSGENTSKYLAYYGAKAERIYTYPFTSIRQADIIPRVLTKEEKGLLRQALDIREDKVIISVGQFIHRKGYDVLLDACRRISSSIGIYIVGGEPTNEYLNLKEKYGLQNVHFIGFKSKEDLQRYYQAADLFVLPTREDIWGLVINEAMANGLPVITTDRCMAGLELVKDRENGFIVPVGNAGAIAEKAQNILGNDALCESMSKCSLEKIAPYTIENMALKHMEVFKELTC